MVLQPRRRPRAAHCPGSSWPPTAAAERGPGLRASIRAGIRCVIRTWWPESSRGLRDCARWARVASVPRPGSRCSSPRGAAAPRAVSRCGPAGTPTMSAGERRRRDRARERAGAVPALQPREGRAAGVIAPRPGRPSSSRATRRTPRPDFLLVATPGRGQDARGVPGDPRGGREQVVVVCPTTALRAQWADAADARRPASRPALAQRRRRLARATSTASSSPTSRSRPAPDLFAHHLARPTFVVLDEIHHAGESATWGTALRAAFDGARHRLALSGTPFRSDARAIPFVRYDEERRCAPDFVYGYARGGRATTSAARSRSGCSTRRCAGASTRRRRSRPSPTSSTRPTTRAACGRRSTPARRCCRRCSATPTRC